MSYIFREIKNLDEIISTYILIYEDQRRQAIFKQGGYFGQNLFRCGSPSYYYILLYDDVQGVPRYLNLCHPFCYNAEATSSAASLKTDYRT